MSLIFKPSEPFHREFFASCLQVALFTAGFVQLPINTAQTEFWARDITGTKCSIIVSFSASNWRFQYFPAIVEGVFVYSKVKKVFSKQSSFSSLHNKKRITTKDREVLFCEAIAGAGIEISEIVKDTLQSARNAWKTCKEQGQCCRCGAPLLTSKANKKYCAEICWAEDEVVKNVIKETDNGPFPWEK